MVWVWLAALGLSALITLLAVAGLIFQGMAEAADARRLAPPGQLVDIGGRRLHVVCRGEGPGPTVVLEAGGGNPAALAQPLQDRVAKFARVCAYDRAGLGWSDPAPSGRTFEDRAHDLDRLLGEIGAPGPYVLVAESFGGLVARSYAQAHPEKVAGLVFVDAAEEESTFGFFDATFYERMRADAARNGLAARFGLIRLAAPKRAAALPVAFMADTRAELVAQMSRPAFWRAAADEISAYEKTPDQRRRAGGFGGLGERPVIVIRHGKPFTGAMAGIEPGWTAGQARLAALSTRGKVIVAKGAGHGIAQEQPDLVAEAVREVWRTLIADAGPSASPATEARR